MGFVFDIIEDVGDAVGDLVEDTVDYVFHGGLEDDIKEVGRDIDDFVNDVIPGGWAGVGAGALLAMGIYRPDLLGLAESGALTSEAVAAAGLDATAVAQGAAAVAPEVAAASASAAASGIAPEIIAMANATLDPIAALNAAQGWTIADTAYLASIGASPALIATAEANNALLTAADSAAAGGGSVSPSDINTQVFDDGSTLTTGADGTVTSTPATDTGLGSTQVFDDGSTLTTGADGTVTSTPATDVVTTTTGAPVVDAGPGVPGLNNPYGTGEVPLWASVQNLGSAISGTLGTAGMLGAGALGAGLLSNAFQPISKGGTGYAPITYTPPDTSQIIPPITNVGVSPGFINPQPMYRPTSDVGSKFFWGRNPYMAVAEDLPYYNQVPNAPATPWGIQQGPTPIDINQFIKNTVNPQWQAALAGSAPTMYAPPAPVVMPIAPEGAPG